MSTSRLPPIYVHEENVNPVNRSGSITTGGVAQVAIPANDGRHGFDIQNTSAGILYIDKTGGTASTASMQLAPGALYETPDAGCPSVAISIFGATTGQTFVATEW